AFVDNTGTKLWKSDGTEAGTVVVKPMVGEEVSELTVVDGTLFFMQYDDLWKSDGTAAGTVQVMEINNPSGASLSHKHLTDVNGRLFFAVDDGAHGTELWTSDGTVAGTTLVKDIYPGGSMYYYPGYYQYPTGYIPPRSAYVLNSSSPTDLTNVNGT